MRPNVIVLALLLGIGVGAGCPQCARKSRPVAGPAVPLSEVEVLPSPDVTQALLEEGRRLYRQECRACHGPEGEVGAMQRMALERVPPDLNEPSALAGYTDEELFARITAGIPEAGMRPRLDMPVRERWALVHYLRTLPPREAAGSPSAE